MSEDNPIVIGVDPGNADVTAIAAAIEGCINGVIVLQVGGRGSSKVPSMIRVLEALAIDQKEIMQANKPEPQKWQGSGKQKMKVMR